jgi:hypothetical protein
MTDKEKMWLDEEIEVEFYNIEEPGMMNKFPYGTYESIQRSTPSFMGENTACQGKWSSILKHVKHLSGNMHQMVWVQW